MKNWKSENRMRLRIAIGLGVMLPVSGAGICCHAQSTEAGPANTLDSGPRTVRTAGTASATDAAQGQVVRVIDDPHSGERWFLLRNLTAPAGPGRMVLESNRQGEMRQSQPGVGVSGTRPVSIPPVIRAGDRLVVEEDSARVEVRLEAVALGPAASGSNLDVRLKIGGKVVRAVALGPGRAAFAPEGGARP
jgi:hypothetical protein